MKIDGPKQFGPSAHKPDQRAHAPIVNREPLLAVEAEPHRDVGEGEHGQPDPVHPRETHALPLQQESPDAVEDVGHASPDQDQHEDHHELPAPHHVTPIGRSCARLDGRRQAPGDASCRGSDALFLILVGIDAALTRGLFDGHAQGAHPDLSKVLFQSFA